MSYLIKSGFSVLLAVVGVAVFATAPGPAHAQSPTTAFTAADTDQMLRLAGAGRFDELLASLEAMSDPDTAPENVAGLIRDLQRQQDNARARTLTQTQAYQEKLAELLGHLGDDDLEDALVAAIEAHGLAQRPDDVFTQPAVMDAVARAQAAAAAAETERDWVTAAGLYRLLNLLYQDSATFRPDLKRVGKHIRVLGLYAPDVLDTLYKAHAKARGDQDDGKNDQAGDDDPLDDEHWTERLAGVQKKMLTQAINQAAQRHVDHAGFKPLVLGALDAVRVLVGTRGLDQTFPSLRDAAKLHRFDDYLQTAIDRLHAPGQTVSRFEADAIVDRVLAMNEATIGLPEQVLIYEMGQGATDNLDDFSSIIWPHDLDQFSRSTRGAFFGVGIQISRRDGRLVVVSPLENTPAQRAGIKAGDIIAVVDGRKADNWSLNRAVTEITGPEHTPVVLGIERGAQDLTFTLKRARIVIESIRGQEHRPLADGGGWDYWVDRPAGIGYVRLSQFIPQTADDLDAAVAQLQREALADGGHLRGLILDLRFNPGGLLESAIDVCDRFIDQGPIVSTVDGQGRKINTQPARKFQTYEPFPVVVLINQGSASASEIVAGALQDYGRAQIVGTRSFGKGSVQDLFGLADHKARLKLTRQYYALPLGRVIHRKPNATTWGIEPDLIVSMTDQQVAEALELRQEIDVLRDPAPAPGSTPRATAPGSTPAPGSSPGATDASEKSDPGVPDVAAHRAAVPDDKAPEAADPDKSAPPSASDLVSRGIDPQLEAALLILKTRQVAHHLAQAQDPDGPQARHSSPPPGSFPPRNPR